MPASIQDAIQTFLPLLRGEAPSADPGNRPLDVDRFLEHAGLFRMDDGVKTVHAAPQDPATFAGLAEGAFLSAGLAQKGADPVNDTKLAELQKAVGDAFPAYVDWSDRAIDALDEEARRSLSEGVRQLLESHATVSYAFYIPVQDGASTKPKAALRSNEGRWTAFSVLLDAGTFKPVLAGFHGLHPSAVAPNAVRLVPWGNVASESLAGKERPVAFVSRGTHSLFEVQGDHESLVPVIAVFTEQKEDLGFTEGTGAAMIGAGIVLVSTGEPVAIGFGILLLIAGLIFWLLEEDAKTGTATVQPAPPKQSTESPEEAFPEPTTSLPPVKVVEHVAAVTRPIGPLEATWGKDHHWWDAACRWGTAEPIGGLVASGTSRPDALRRFVEAIAITSAPG